MNTDKQRIYNGDWKTLHPYSGSAPTDLYYITLANKVLAAIRAVETSLDESDYRKIDETEQKELACILTAYFEDIISQTGIFQAFTRIHGKRFGKPLPFYTLDEDYTPGEINIEEVQFLVWHYHMQLNNLDIPYSPTLDTFAAIASDVMEIFETEYESAPENEKLLQYFRIDEKNLITFTHCTPVSFGFVPSPIYSSTTVSYWKTKPSPLPKKPKKPVWTSKYPIW